MRTYGISSLTEAITKKITEQSELKRNVIEHYEKMYNDYANTEAKNSSSRMRPDGLSHS